jgi:two-component system sensor histidine kinase KdpD
VRALLELTLGSAVARVALVLVALVAATATTAVLEDNLGIADASPIYLIAVVVAAALLGTWAAVATSAASFVLYDYLFTRPRFTFQVADPAEWLSLLLFVLVAVVIGRLAALLRERAEMADRRVRESVALVAISREIAMATSFAEAAAGVAERLRVDAEMSAVWITRTDAVVPTVAGAGEVPGESRGQVPWTLVRSAFDGSSDWIRVIEGSVAFAGDPRLVGPARKPDAAPAPDTLATDEGETYRVAIGHDAAPVGWIHATRAAGDPRPGRGARRILALAADQLGVALRRDELQDELTTAEVARQSDALRAAILDSVSHDLRTPLASIRAQAGGLLDPAGEPAPDEVRIAATAIDDEAARLGDLVGSLLDMGRIQAGAVRADLRPYDVGELVETALRHRSRTGAARRIDVDVPEDLPAVLVDAVLFDVALGNLVANAEGHTPMGAATRIRARVVSGGVVLDVDDAGPGVPADALGHLFDRFYRVPDPAGSSRQGLGMGLAIARGFVEALGGEASAEASDLGGLRIRLRLPVAPEERTP